MPLGPFFLTIPMQDQERATVKLAHGKKRKGGDKNVDDTRMHTSHSFFTFFQNMQSTGIGSDHVFLFLLHIIHCGQKLRVPTCRRCVVLIYIVWLVEARWLADLSRCSPCLPKKEEMQRRFICRSVEDHPWATDVCFILNHGRGQGC